jgi:hypothetical protein
MWSKTYIEHGLLPHSKRGQHTKVASLLDDEDVKMDVLNWLRSQQKNSNITAKSLQDYVSTALFPNMGAKKSSIGLSTARKWLKRLGWKYGKHQKGVYVDGHERADVIDYRGKFLNELKALEDISLEYEDNLVDEVPKDIPSGAKRHVFVTHDESCFNANDDGGQGWEEKGNPALRPKGRGKALMVSEFLTESFGRLAIPPNDYARLQDPPFPREATEIIEPGKNANGYWTGEDLVKQVGASRLQQSFFLVNDASISTLQIRDRAIPIFNHLHPGCIGVFLFDNSSNHGLFAPDALRVQNMNLNPGGKQSILRPGRLPNGEPQEMVFLNNHENEQLRGQAKGVNAKARILRAATLL